MIVCNCLKYLKTCYYGRLVQFSFKCKFQLMALLPTVLALISILHQCNAWWGWGGGDPCGKSTVFDRSSIACSYLLLLACMLTFSVSGCSIQSITLTSNFTVTPLGSTAVNGSFTCSFQASCCSGVTVKWLRESISINSSPHYTITTQNSGTSYTSTLSVNSTMSASHAGSYRCKVMSTTHTHSSSSLSLLVLSKYN